MFKSIQQKLKEASILEENEPILCFIPVVDYLKQQQQFKKIAKEEIASLLPNIKQYFFLASIKTADNDSTPILYLLKQNEKNNEYKLKVTYNLSDLKRITQIDEKVKQMTSNGQQLIIDVFAFELLFKTDNEEENYQDESKYKFVWQCGKVEERNEFLDTLWKLSQQFLKKNEQPIFVNYSFEKKIIELNKQGEKNNEKRKIEAKNAETKQSDEDSLLKLMSECNFASLSAEKFIERLQNELLNLDISNIESIMNSEQNTIKYLEMIDQAMEEIEKIDLRLRDYEDKISAVGEAVRIVGEHDDVIQIQQKNQHALFDLLEYMVGLLEYPNEYKVLLNECDFSSPQRVARCIVAANALLDLLETDLPNGLKKMKSYEEQRKYFEHLKLRFCNSSSNHLRNAIGHATNKHLESYKIIENSLNILPLHKQIYDDLLVYRDLMPWMFRSNCSFQDQNQTKTYFNDIRQNYIETVKQLYYRELVPFCNCARAKIVKNEKPKATASIDSLKMAKTSLEKAYVGDFFTIKVDQQSKETLKLVFIKLLNQIMSAVQAEQFFCQEFFASKNQSVGREGGAIRSSNNDNVSQPNLFISNGYGAIQPLARYPSDASLASNSTNNSKQTQQDSKIELLILNDIFMNTIEEQVKLVMDNIFRTESMMILFLYSDLLSRVLTCHNANTKQYMHQPLVALLRFAKEKCDEYCNFFKESIREYKANRKEKIGILRYVLYFEEFVKEAESCWEPIKKDMYEKLCIIYQSIVNEIFKGIESVAAESLKTPPEVVRFQNYHHMNHVMRSINGLKDSTKYARDQYVSWKQSYIKEYFGRPLEKIANFFEKVDAKIERGYKHEDISYQLDLSVNNLREIIKEYPAREVKRGLDNLYNRVEKHLVENSSLLEVVWCDMSNEFIKQYKNYENLITKCYPGQKIAFEFTEQDICLFFQEIAQTH